VLINPKKKVTHLLPFKIQLPGTTYSIITTNAHIRELIEKNSRNLAMKFPKIEADTTSITNEQQ